MPAMSDDYDDIQAAEEEEFYPNEEDSTEFTDTSEPCLPDGIGLELSDVKKMVAAVNNYILQQDDPLLIQLTILNAYLCEVEKLHDRHNVALTQVMTSQMEKYVSGVKETTDSLGAVLATTSVEAIRDIFSQHDAVIREHDASIRRGSSAAFWCAAVITVSALFNVAVFLWK